MENALTNAEIGEGAGGLEEVKTTKEAEPGVILQTSFLSELTSTQMLKAVP